MNLRLYNYLTHKQVRYQHTFLFGLLIFFCRICDLANICSLLLLSSDNFICTFSWYTILYTNQHFFSSKNYCWGFIKLFVKPIHQNFISILWLRLLIFVKNRFFHRSSFMWRLPANRPSLIEMWSVHCSSTDYHFERLSHNHVLNVHLDSRKGGLETGY